jgi:hypothetical protein
MTVTVFPGGSSWLSAGTGAVLVGWTTEDGAGAVVVAGAAAATRTVLGALAVRRGAGRWRTVRRKETVLPDCVGSRPNSIGEAISVSGDLLTRVRSRSRSERVARSFTWEPHPATATKVMGSGKRKATRMTTSG